MCAKNYEKLLRVDKVINLLPQTPCAVFLAHPVGAYCSIILCIPWFSSV